MSAHKLPLTFRSALETICVFLSILSAVVLLIVWALADTIAARNISIAVGLIASSIWILIARPKITRLDLMVPALLMGVPIWLWIIYFFFSIDPVTQYKEMAGTWLRVMLLIIFGFNLAFICSQKSTLEKWIWAGLLIIPVASLLFYLCDVYKGLGWNIYGYTAFYKTKVAGVYFLMWPLFLGCAGIHKGCVDHVKNNSFYHSALILIPSIVLIFLSISMFLVIHALTAILVSIILSGALIIICFRHSMQYQLGERIIITTIMTFLAIACIYQYWLYDQAHEKKLYNLIADILFSINSRENLAWASLAGRDNSLPQSYSGIQVNGSTYQRTSWFIEGLRYLISNPLGSGDVHFSFGKYVNIAYPGSNTTKTHCGWLDLALGVGIPGLLLLWSGMYVTLKSTLQNLRVKSINFSNFAILWILAGSFLLWWPAEISYREFIEHYFFVLTFLAATTTKVMDTKKDKDNSISLPFGLNKEVDGNIFRENFLSI